MYGSMASQSPSSYNYTTETHSTGRLTFCLLHDSCLQFFPWFFLHDFIIIFCLFCILHLPHSVQRNLNQPIIQPSMAPSNPAADYLSCKCMCMYDSELNDLISCYRDLFSNTLHPRV